WIFRATPFIGINLTNNGKSFHYAIIDLLPKLLILQKNEEVPMKRISAGLFLFLLISITGPAQDKKQFYVGVTGGLVMPRVLHENWNNKTGTQTALLVEELNNGFLVGGKVGCTPKALGKILSVEFEYNYQRAGFNRLTTGGFFAGDSAIAGFTYNCNNSSINFNSLFLNILARYPVGIVHPYIGIGPGFTHTSISFNEPGLFVESSNHSDFSWQALAGVDFDVTPRLSMGGGYKYFSVKTTMTWANGTNSKYDPSSNNFFMDLKFHF
ncbi:MAG: outer membrane beta-barrel protein, partial [Bacteroidota bacterium]